MAEMQLNEIRVDPLTRRQGDPLANRPEQGSKMAMSEIQGTSSQTNERSGSKMAMSEIQGTASQTNERSLWLSGIMRGVEDAKTKQRYSGPMIPKVPDKLKHENEDCYKPSVVSIGPYHYKDRQNKLHEVEKLKVQMARQFVLDSKIKDIEILYSEVAKVAENAKRFYEGCSLRCFDDEQFTRMMFLDGCFILQFIHGVMYNKLDMSDQQIIDVKRDLLLLENQLPFAVLKSLMSLKNDGDDRGMEINIKNFLLHQILQQSDQRRPVWVLNWLVKGYLLLLLIYTSVVYPFHILQGKDSFFFSPLFGILVAGVIFVCKMAASLLRSLLWGKKWQAAEYNWPPHQEPAHILELLHSMFIRSKKEKHKQSPRSWCIYLLPERLRNLFHKSKLGKCGHNLYYSAKDLQKVGIHFKPSRTSSLRDVKFVSKFFYGKLKIPSITIEKATRSMLLNLVAYETAAFLDNLWVTSYICFIDSLINDAEDVKVLRSEGVLINYLGPDQKVADLFNQIGSSLEPNTNTVYNDVKREINVSCDSMWKKWIAEWLQTYFISPWAFIAFVAAAAVLILTATQTYYTVYPKK
ncbi:hypothetical protein POTOM_024736 [Populus tomentosa]|uniref:Uncharacterized protein n=1 Tax=Populus tomentosa TaxID=118781 RepID=A0A8X7ZTX0_POPTO|nr:hypothetical protein POTOM_024736 [Populus tomentosa]